jgi:hypothetical protein
LSVFSIAANLLYTGMDLAAWTNFVFFSILAAAVILQASTRFSEFLILLQASWYLGIVSVDANTAAMAVLLPLLVIMGLIHV